MPSCGPGDRAAKSAFLGLCEGLPSDAAGIRRRHFDIANNSLHELVGAIDLAEAIGAMATDKAQEILSLATRLKRGGIETRALRSPHGLIPQMTIPYPRAPDGLQ
jgi:hypothetical protein